MGKWLPVESLELSHSWGLDFSYEMTWPIHIEFPYEMVGNTCSTRRIDSENSQVFDKRHQNHLLLLFTTNLVVKCKIY